MGINFVLSPMPIIDAQANLRFQQSLVEYGIDFSNVQFKEREVAIARDAPTQLQIKVLVLGPPSLGQLLIVAPNPNRELDLFGKEAEAIVRAYESTWPAKPRQIISTDASLRDLYETSAEHAFQELWEMRLHQPPGSLTALGRPVLGGGLRFVMPPLPGDAEPLQIEVKIESYLRDTRKLFIETQFTWPSPLPPDTPIDPQTRLRQVDRYVQENVELFMAGGAR